MARPNPIRSIMEAPLPSITYQRHKSFRPVYADITYAYSIINRHIFDNQLRQPEITMGRLRKTLAYCEWLPEPYVNKSWVRIKLSDKWFCQQWFMNVLAHEMIHQYQWDVGRWVYINTYGRDIYQLSGAHGPSFFEWRDKFSQYGLTLKTAFGQRRWFKHQDFNKC